MKIKNTDSLLILLMKLLAVSTVTMNYIIGESGHINWENSYTMPCPCFFCFKDWSRPMFLRFIFVLKYNYAKVLFHFISFYIQRLHWSKNDLRSFLLFEKKFSRLTNRGVIENNRIGFDFWKCFWIRNIQSWRDISSWCKSSKLFHFLYHVSLWGRNYRIICYSKADHIADNGKRSWKGVNDLSLL